MSGRELARLSVPAVLLLVGAAFTLGVDRQKPVPLERELSATVPASIGAYRANDMELGEDEVRVAGVSDYLMRAYRAPAGAGGIEGFTVYVGYYDSQTQGRTIHSPKNCLPGSGWEALQSQTVTLDAPHGEMTVNRYLLQRSEQRALVLYWYQGRGRIEANEYVVKANLLRDSALRGRSEEALVRIVVPVQTSVEDAFTVASAAAVHVVGGVAAALP